MSKGSYFRVRGTEARSRRARKAGRDVGMKLGHSFVPNDLKIPCDSLHSCLKSARK